MTRILSVMIVLATLAAGCGPARQAPKFGEGAAPSVARIHLGTSADGAFGWIDGSVAQSFRARVTADRDQTVVRTGFAPGADQGKVLVFDDDGSRALDYALPYQSPIPTPEALRVSSADPSTRRQAMVAGGDQVVPFQADGRRFLLVGTSGRHEPSALVLLEFDPSGAATERLVFWNEGSIRHVFASGTHVGLFGAHNALDTLDLRKDVGERYATVLAVFRIPESTPDVSGTEPTRGRSPRGENPHYDEGGGYAAYYRLPTRQSVSIEIARMPSVEGGHMRMVDGTGATLDVDLATYEPTVTGGADGRVPGPPIRMWRGR